MVGRGALVDSNGVTYNADDDEKVFLDDRGWGPYCSKAMMVDDKGSTTSNAQTLGT